MNSEASTLNDGGLFSEQLVFPKGKKLAYYFNGTQVYPRKLRRRFQTYDELGKLISVFAKTKYCSPISDKVLEEFAMKTRSEIVTFWNANFKSRFCSLVA